MQQWCAPDQISLIDVVKSLEIREEDYLGSKFRKYLEIAKDVYRDLNLQVVKQSKRVQIQVDRHTHAIRLPDDLLMWTSVSVTDECQQIIPLVLNKNLTGPLVDLNLANDCDCECKCTDALCGRLKHYETIYKVISAPMPDGTMQNFDCFERKIMYPNGQYYLEYSEPVVTYSPAGDIVSTQLQTKTEFICNLEVKACGCVVDNTENRKTLGSCCGAQFLTNECGCSLCPPVQSNAFYGYQQLGDKIYFDENFCYDYVLLRYYPNTEGADLRIPKVAKTALIKGIKAESLTYDGSTGYAALAWQRREVMLKNEYEREKKRLFRLLNRFNMKAFYMRLLENRPMPGPRDRWWRGYPTFYP